MTDHPTNSDTGMPEVPAPASPAAEDVLVAMRPALAGPGEPDDALRVLVEAGWRLERDELANVLVFSPDGLVYVGFLPEAGHPQAAPDLGPALWTVRAYSPYGEVQWMATFDDYTPAELVAAFLTCLVDPAGITRTRKEADQYGWTRELPTKPTRQP